MIKKKNNNNDIFKNNDKISNKNDDYFQVLHFFTKCLGLVRGVGSQEGGNERVTPRLEISDIFFFFFESKGLRNWFVISIIKNIVNDVGTTRSEFMLPDVFNFSLGGIFYQFWVKFE